MNLDLFRGIVPFVVVAEERSFRKAAARLGVSAAAVSKSVQTLEAQLGIALLERTSRVVSLTQPGEIFFERCRAAVASVQGAREALEATRREPQGELVVSAPFVVVPLLAPALALLRSRYARLGFSVRITDQLSKLAEEAVDVAVRVGPMPASSLVARRLRRTRLFTVASPAYLSRRGPIAQLEDLARHDCLVLVAPNNKPRPWLFASGPMPVAATLLVDHGPTLVDAALAGLGVTQAFDFMVAEHLRAGRLVQVLGDLTSEGPDVHAVCAPGRRASANVRAAFHALADVFGIQEQ
ncbi:LysR family transcriptional regulator [Polyangium aurulentum]|uniref:LysR family transcriptional regulator n=1 Tax=Polyangium aurulentum TaxID=2567896 RepID=UPI0010AE7F60|nr:LysR family transcriptional regulator [Polyangium aurulentum]UQA63070.1 LysR family transcriptional regulator [Polyangium aurulentum]